MPTITEIYENLNGFRQNPNRYNSSCNDYHLAPKIQKLQNLTVDWRLEEAAKFQATHQCLPVTHSTCSKYCWMFGSCNPTDRIKMFTQYKSQNEYEILLYGPKIPQYQPFLNTHGHCHIILRSDITHFGAYYHKNLLIVVFARFFNFLRR